MKLIFIYGPPGVGKLTVAQELAKLTRYKLFHNHLTVDLVYALFDFGTKPFIELREIIWMMAFQKAKEEGIHGMIFTFAPEASVPGHFIPDVMQLIEDDHNSIHFVELTCQPDALRERIANPSRSKYAKGMSPEHIEQYYQRDALIPMVVHERKLTIDNTTLSPQETAIRIAQQYALPTQ
ncbi:MAG TPA: AAA family ATPase [Ktedonobacterales bacterium]|nr:AAA family ATPase [Ktedonobacterales bacterium]